MAKDINVSYGQVDGEMQRDFLPANHKKPHLACTSMDECNTGMSYKRQLQ